VRGTPITRARPTGRLRRAPRCAGLTEDLEAGRAALVPPEGPYGRFHEARRDAGDVAEALPGALVAEREVLGGDALGMADTPRRPVDQQADLGKPDPEQPGAEAVFPGTHDGRDRQRIRLVGRRPADQRQDISGPGCQSQADPRRGQRAEDFVQLAGAQPGVLCRRQAGELLTERRAHLRIFLRPLLPFLFFLLL